MSKTSFGPSPGGEWLPIVCVLEPVTAALCQWTFVRRGGLATNDHNDTLSDYEYLHMVSLNPSSRHSRLPKLIDLASHRCPKLRYPLL